MSRMKIRYWGVRGSIPVPGPDTVRYGGNTSCVEVTAGSTRIVLDAGTGIRALGAGLANASEIHLIFTHLHWDHIQGFPFFIPIYRTGFKIHIYSGHKADVSLESVLKGQMQEPNFPVSLGGLPAAFTFNEIHKGISFNIGDVIVDTMTLNHPNEAMGLRFTDSDGFSFVHLTDHEHSDAQHGLVVDFCKSADVLSMDTMFTPEDYGQHRGWGHSHWRHAVGIASQAGCRKLVLFHHDPRRTDEDIDRIQAAARAEFADAIAAYEGLEIESDRLAGN